MWRWFGIRHVRYWWLRRQIYRYAADCADVGLGLGQPNAADLIFLDLVWRGQA
jgi:hypothetical protein